MHAAGALYLLMAAHEHVAENDEDEQNPHQPMNFIFLLSLAEYVRDEGQQHVAENTEGDSVRDAVRERHERNRHERRNANDQVIEVDLAHGLHHQNPDDNQRRRRSRSRNKGNDRRQEQGEQEADARRDRGQARASAGRYPGRALDEGRHGACTEHGAAADRDRIDEHGFADALVAFFAVLHETGAVRRADQRSEGIEQFNEGEGQNNRHNADAHNAGEVEFEHRHLRQVRHPLSALQRAEINQSHRNGNQGRSDDAEQNRARHVQNHQYRNERQSDNGEQHVRVGEA